MHQRRWGVALAAAVLCGFDAPRAFAQVPEVPVECGVDVRLTGAALFNPPVPGPVVYEWRDASGEVVGREETLSLGALKLGVGSHPLTLTARGADDRRPTQTVVVVITDNTPPRLRSAFGAIEIPVGTVDVTSVPGLTVSDDCDAAPALTFSPPGPYGAGETPVTVTARDSSGNTAEFRVTFQVAAPPPAAPPPPPVSQPVERPAPAPPAPVQATPTPPEPSPLPAPLAVAPVAAPAQAIAPPSSPLVEARAFPWWIAAVAALVLAAGTWALKQTKSHRPAITTIVARPHYDGGAQRLRTAAGRFRVVRRVDRDGVDAPSLPPAAGV